MAMYDHADPAGSGVKSFGTLILPLLILRCATTIGDHVFTQRRSRIHTAFIRRRYLPWPLARIDSENN
jgi:hypothetical protein